MIREIDILESLRRGGLRLGPLEISAEDPVRIESGPRGITHRPDAVVNVRWEGACYRFAAEVKAISTPRVFEQALLRATAVASDSGLPPMIITPFISERQLMELESRGISGLDMCGNGIVTVPGKMLAYRTGNANRYPAGQKIRNVYRGNSSLIARVFLLRPEYATVGEVREEIVRRGGRVTLGTVSKVISVLREDLIISREARKSRLLQADALLDRLSGAFAPPKTGKRRQYQWRGKEGGLADALGEVDSPLVRTGEGSADAYAVAPGERTVRCYCRDLTAVERQLDGAIVEASRFADLELIESDDPTVWFDPRPEGPVAPASPVQCWLELAVGDKRQKEAARQVRVKLVEGLRAQGYRGP